MIPLTARARGDAPLRVLCLGAHSDDIEIGCGGTILKLIEQRPDACFTWVVFSAAGPRAAEAAASADLFLQGVQDRQVIVKNYRDGFFPYTGAEIKDEFEQLKRTAAPDVILTHHRNDMHQDHRLIWELTWNTWRDHLILEYEIPKYDGDLTTPNVLVTLDEAICRRKVEYLMAAFPSQRSKQWFSDETFRAVLRLRGIEANSPGLYAEGFHCRKMVWAP